MPFKYFWPMMLRTIFLLCILFYFSFTTLAQQLLKGKVFISGKEHAVAGATITNVNSGAIHTSDKDGNYSIAAAEKDKVLFSFIGYITDTIITEAQLLASGYDAYLSNKPTTLQRVIVTGNYQADSLKRRQAYQHIYDKQTGITGGNGPQDGVGISFSPISYFSKDSRETRRLKKRLAQQEEDAYIDYVFPAMWVSSITGLQGDSLRLFMYQYRPSYKFCRENNKVSLTVYVNDKYKEFMRPKR